MLRAMNRFLLFALLVVITIVTGRQATPALPVEGLDWNSLKPHAHENPRTPPVHAATATLDKRTDTSPRQSRETPAVHAIRRRSGIINKARRVTSTAARGGGAWLDRVLCRHREREHYNVGMTPFDLLVLSGSRR